MARRFRKEDIETHAEGYSGPSLPAVNVKVYRSMTAKDVAEANDMALGDDRFTLEWIEENLDDRDMDTWFRATCEDGWENLHTDAEEVFGTGVKVYAEGRSGGWAVVHGLPEVETWDTIMVSKWAKFAKWARATADAVPEMMAELIAINVFEQWATEQDNPKRLADGSACPHCLGALS